MLCTANHTFLSRNEDIVSSAKLSDNLQISQRYILQIAGKLRDGGLIDTQAGMRGGYALTKASSSISVYDIIALLEDDMSIPQCVTPCKNANSHDARSILKDYYNTYHRF